MLRLPLPDTGASDPAALACFFREQAAAAAAAGRPHLVSICRPADPLDPLAVLESIFEPDEIHCYIEHPASGSALAGADAVFLAGAGGPSRFAELHGRWQSLVEDAVLVGDTTPALSGPLFFFQFGFNDEAAEASPFPAAQLFVARWQVVRTGGACHVTASVMIGPGSDPEAVAARIWRAHSRLSRLDYGRAGLPGPAFTAAELASSEAGGGAGYRSAVRAALADIAAGRYDKIVLARARDLLAPAPWHPLVALNRLRETFPSCHSFSVANGRGQSFIGSSPERLLSISGRTLRTEALAGSAPRGRSAVEDAALGRALAASDKNRREHALVLGSLRRRLEPLGCRLSPPPPPRLLQLHNVQHLHTPVEAALPEGVHLLDVLAALHPTPAVGGTPREKAVPRLRELEPFDRGLYAGAIGWLDWRGGGECFVGIRSALIDGCRARLYAGAGIVAGSDPDDEQAETDLKFSALLDALA